MAINSIIYHAFDRAVRTDFDHGAITFIIAPHR